MDKVNIILIMGHYTLECFKTELKKVKVRFFHPTETNIPADGKTTLKTVRAKLNMMIKKSRKGDGRKGCWFINSDEIIINLLLNFYINFLF